MEGGEGLMICPRCHENEAIRLYMHDRPRIERAAGIEHYVVSMRIYDVRGRRPDTVEGLCPDCLREILEAHIGECDDQTALERDLRDAVL